MSEHLERYAHFKNFENFYGKEFLKMETKEKLQSFFKNVGEDKRQFALDTIDEYVFFRDKIEELKKYPLIEVSTKKPSMQRVTAAGKQIKEYSQVIDAKRTTLIRILSSVENSEADKLTELLSRFKKK